MERIRQILRVIFRVGFVCDIDVVPLVEIESDQVPLYSLLVGSRDRWIISEYAITREYMVRRFAASEK
jgi:hypothetical protein